MRYHVQTAVALLAAATAAAQTEPPAGRAGLGTTVSMQGGMTAGSMGRAGHALGGSVVQELGARWALEASAAHLGEGMGSDALSLDASLLFHLRPAREKAAPYLALGGGLYRTSFDMDDPSMRDGSGPMYGGGMRGPGMMGGQYGPGPYGNPYGHMPGFYAHRMPAAGPDAWHGRRSFTDPALSAGGGIRIDLGSRMFLRPDGRVLVAFDGGDTFTVGLVTVNFGWRF